MLNPTLSRLRSAAGIDRRFVRGEGVWLFDCDGRRYLDAWSQYGAVALGHAHPRVMAAAMTDSLTIEAGRVRPSNRRPPVRRASRADAIYAELREAARSKAPRHETAEEAITVMQLIDAARRSARIGQVVDLAEKTE